LLFDRLENLSTDAVLLEQMGKIQDSGLIWNRLGDYVDPSKAPEEGGVSISISSSSGSKSGIHCYNESTSSITSKGNGGLPPFAEGW